MSSNSSSNSSGSQRLNFLPSKPRESEKLTLDFPPRAGSLLRSAAAFNHQAATYETNELDIPGLPSKGLSYSSSVAHSHSPLFGQKRPHNALASGTACNDDCAVRFSCRNEAFLGGTSRVGARLLTQSRCNQLTKLK